MVLIKRLQLITTSLRSCILSTRPEHPMDHGKLGPLPPYSTTDRPRQTAPSPAQPRGGVHYLFPATYTLNLMQNLPPFVTDMP